MTTAVEPEIDPKESGAAEEEEEESLGPQEFKWYCKPENMHEILQKRWGLFFILSSLVYSYHFVSIILGMNQYVHYSRFLTCGDALTFDTASAVYDSALMVVLVFHIIEWVRQTVLITTILVGVKWLPVYYLLSINFPFGMIACLVGFISGFTGHAECATA